MAPDDGFTSDNTKIWLGLSCAGAVDIDVGSGHFVCGFSIVGPDEEPAGALLIIR
jgi:hypothetical protein